MKFKTILIVGVAAACAIVAGVVLGLRTPAPTATVAATTATTPTPRRRPLRTLNVDVSWSATIVRITNNGPDGGGGPMEIYVNGDPPFGFRADSTVPPQGQAVVVPLFQFVNREGDRFNPVNRAVKVLWVGGGGYDFQSYGKGN